MNEVIEQLLIIIDAQQALIAKTTKIIAECKSVDDAPSTRNLRGKHADP